ncbi:PHB depolymerase family esterase [Chromobacterium vaccinii]|uniref:extracellular catalytic domain type 2 short-chain-length polyhydroxyalkanoate depolymerase n=1 Tax=Chromobacterium vaccinii TaxID=1108595 RepID=UPI001E488291|nr:PHB depolymerase family esterase [Chromobacterium vaccinii]MCD4486429.1 PHB depolymerase family esterase [Chromobacterium vaccinii]MCD4498381.1 PHB depolymerase family esterase [Chromobacterium vaccinii]
MKLTSLLCLAATLPLAAWAADPLPAFHGDARQSSVSGLSSGAFMAAQYQVAYSASVVGAGVVAGGPYYCAQGSLPGTVACMAGPPPQPAQLLASAKQFAAAGRIDPLADLAKRRVYLFSGTQDNTVHTPVVDAAASFFQLAGVPAAQIAYQKQLPAGHAQITPAYGNDCGATASPYINHCTWQGQGYDQAGLILQHIYGSLQAKASALTGRIVRFNQKPYAAAGSSLADEGFVYVPRACAEGEACKVHIALHGCQQYAGKVGDAFYAHAGYNNWADSNRILVLYPQTTTSAANPQGCWDWFGYTGPAYAWKSGLQMRALKAMADRLVSAP